MSAFVPPREIIERVLVSFGLDYDLAYDMNYIVNALDDALWEYYKEFD